MKKRTLVLLGAALVVMGIAIGGTMAWLTSTTSTVKNIFTIGDITAALSESDTTPTSDGAQKTYTMIPGDNEQKDPMVTIKAGSAKCWVFVRVTEENAASDFLEYDVNSSVWKEVPNVEGVYYYKEPVDASSADQELYILACQKPDDPGHAGCTGCVTVKDTVKKSDLQGLTEDTYPALTFVAYAIQSDNLKDSEGNALGEGNIADIWSITSNTDNQ